LRSEGWNQFKRLKVFKVKEKMTLHFSQGTLIPDYTKSSWLFYNVKNNLKISKTVLVK
jgi:hypothetical protein